MAKKEVEVIDRGGAKTVAKKTSFITWTKRIFAILTIVWVVFVAWFPLHIKNNYAEPIKKSLVVSMFFDLQRNIVEQYEKLLKGIKNSINLDKPVAVALQGVKMASDVTATVTDTTAKAKQVSDEAKEKTSKAKKITGLFNKFGVDTTGADKAVDSVDGVIEKADKTIKKVDDTAQLVNAQLDKAEKSLVKLTQTEVDKVIDAAIKHEIDKGTGNLGTTLLTNYGIKHVYPWEPSSWGVATKIYDNLEKTDVELIRTITATIDKYFGYAAWGLVGAFWTLGALLWFLAFKKTKAFIAPFVVCPRCGHTFADKRTALGLLKVFQPWTWF